jgi:hypothetical protein
MKIAKLIVLLAGITGVVAFFVPLATLIHDGKNYPVSPYQLFVGVEALEKGLDTAPAQVVSEKDKQDAYEALSQVKGIVGAIRRKFGRFAGLVSIVLGAASFLVFAGMQSLDLDTAHGITRGPSPYLLAATGLLAVAGGLFSLVSPDRGGG